LRQFVDVPRARATLRLLEQVDFKDRRFFAEALDRTLAVALAEGEVDYVSPLGGMGDSSAMLSYFMNDVSPDRRRPVVQLEIALERGPRNSIIVWDDFCGAGGHATTTLAQWLGKTLDSEFFLKEPLADELTPERKAALERVQLKLGFALAMPSGVQRVKT